MADISVESLEKSLQGILDVAEKTSLRKGGVDNSGTHGSEGPQGGGQGSESDAGVIDHMMIAKMIQAGVDVQTAANFAAFMSMDEDEDEDEDVEKSARASSLTKSFRESVRDELPPETQEMVDITPYLDSMTTALGEHLAVLDSSIQKSNSERRTVESKMARALHQVGSLVKSQAKVIDALNDRLGLVEKAPVAAPRGAQGTAQPFSKSMPGEAGTPEESLTKSEILNALTYMNLEKGQRSIGGRSVSDIVTGLEAGNVWDRDTDAAVRNFVKSLNPDEKRQALSGN